MGDESPDEEPPDSEGSEDSGGSDPATDEGFADQEVPETDFDGPDSEETTDLESHGADLSEDEVEQLEQEWDPREPYNDLDYGAVADEERAKVGDGDADEESEADDDDADEESEADAGDSDTDDGTGIGPNGDFDPDVPANNLYKSPADTADTADSTAEAEAKSDGGYADGSTTPGTGGSEVHVPDTDDYEVDGFDGPESDQEMPLADHIEEMVKRLGVVLVVMAAVSGVVFPFGADIINFLWYSVIVSNPVPAPRVYAPLALVLARLKVATLAGFIIGLPVFVYETYLFMRPGLYPKERRYYLASVPTSLVLASVGVLFAYFLVLPALFTYFLYYSEGVTVIAFGLTETFDLMVLMLGWFALIFQIPLFVMLATMMGLVSRVWLVRRRLYFWGAFLGIAFLFAPDPTGMAPIIVAATMVGLFEGTLFLQKWSRRGWDAVFG